MEINIEQKREVVRLYREQNRTIKQIMEETGVGSTQTIYCILDEAGVPRLRRRVPFKKRSINFDLKTWKIIEKANPKNLSEWVCNMVVKGATQ